MRAKVLILGLMAVWLAAPSHGMTLEGCGAGQCADCHSLGVEEASRLLGKGVDRVLRVEFAEVSGLWLVEVERNRQRFPLFVDFSKSYVVAGNVTRLAGGKSPAGRSPERPRPIDIAGIPLEDALLLGRAGARTKVIVFTDPECPFCRKLHAELQEVVRREPEVAFLIKLYPLEMHPDAYAIARSVVCGKSLSLLEESFAGRPVPPPRCETPVVDETIALARRLGINSTPTLILPDGRIEAGFKSAEQILQLLQK